MMSEFSTPTDSPALPDSAQSTMQGNRSRFGSRLAIVLPLLLALLLAAHWWNTRNEFHQLRREMAQRLQAGDVLNNETKVVARSVQEGFRELQSKVAVLESKQQEAQSQQLALEQLYQDLSRTRDDWALAEIEQVLATASQQLQLAGNVRGALIALQNADNRLALSDTPQFITIRRALARDMEKLKALPSVDLTGLALRMDSAIAQIDSLPLLAGERPALHTDLPPVDRSGTAAGKAAAVPPSAGLLAGLLASVKDKWNALAGEMWGEVRQLVRVRTVQTPEALLLAPTEAYYARENLKLRLLGARLALLSRNESAFRSDLADAQGVIARYFDTSARQTQAVQALLKQVRSSDLSIEMPTLADSLNAVRNYKATP
jgi:uroporphyrin-3 C-methyltransferase/uroporphyrinogen III methyltransferase/synthase